jgi:DNA-binding CsgD family transcriptional regulator
VGKRVSILILGLGFGFFLALNALTIWNPLSFLSSRIDAPRLSFYVVLEIAFICSFFLFVALSRYLKPAPARNFLGDAAVFLLIGLLLLLLCESQMLFLPTASIIWLIYGAGICLGIGTASGFLCWMHVFALFDREVIKNAIVLASIFSAVPHLFSSIFLDDTHTLIVVITVVLMPIALIFVGLSLWQGEKRKGGAIESVCDMKSGRGDRPDLGQGGRPDATDEPDGLTPKGSRTRLKELVSSVKAPVICAVMFGLIGPAVGSAALDAQIPVVTRALVSQTGNVLAALALYVLWRGFKLNVTITRIFLTLFPVLATAFLLFPLLQSTYWPLFLALSDFLFTLVSIAMMMLCFEESKRSGVSLTVVYGVIAGVVYCSRLTGVVLGGLMAVVESSSSIRIVSTVLLLLAFVSILYLYVRRESKSQGTKDTILRGATGEAMPVNGTARDGEADILSRKCSILAQRFMLSHRQAQVLDYLAHGRNVPAIARELFLSQSTVRTYVKSLHTNLGVHSRQELIDLIQNTNHPIA